MNLAVANAQTATKDLSFDLLRRIRVAPPYFNLENMSLAGERLYASAVAQTRIENERGPMAAAEIGRHAAIAGSCLIAALQNDDRPRYYLAQEAVCTYLPSDAPFGTLVQFEVSEPDISKRKARVSIRAHIDNVDIAHLSVSYTVLTEATFGRLFGAHKKHAAPVLRSSYPIKTRGLQPGGNSAQQLLLIQAEDCAGHFPDYPALPVAVLMGQLSYLAGTLLDRPYRVTRGNVSARDLCWAGELVTFSAQEIADDCEPHERALLCRASVDGVTKGEMRLWLTTEL